jgi:cardiolipin synthase (CMP-forming)
VCIWVTGALTILSATAYFWAWLKHMASYEPQPAPLPARKSHREPIKTGAGSRVRTS